MTTYIVAPQSYLPAPGGPAAVFLAGGISGCADWQAEAAAALLAAGLVVINPRRPEGLAVDDPERAPAQIAWEHHHLHQQGVFTLFWFPGSGSVQPIALFELGVALGEGRPLAVGVDPGYLRRLDVHEQLRHARPGLVVHPTLAEVVAQVIAEARPA
ncbi:nucleoside 2-deoxyribosyltransferase domain-containing protein [Kitasatospora sp. NPDC002040]|uniref:nucleoside 2-deoxyribosyltransferase domain-containing protein n=1 Tax=Kitasatospora sp. NPDC002040 TaxID=3154661 RepID=UPI0033308E35